MGIIKNRKYHVDRANSKDKKHPSDEYYTKYEEVEDIFENIIYKEDLKDKIIYCPADGEHSNFVIYLKDHKDDIQYKELIYTSDDMMTHEDLFERADYIITNPPFSILPKELLPLLKRIECKFFLFGSQMMQPYYIRTFLPNECKYIHRPHWMFNTTFISEQTGRNECSVNGTIYLTNMNIKETFNECSKMPKNFLTKTIDEIPNVFSLEEGFEYLNIDRMENYPKDYYEPVWCPITVLQYKYTKYLKYVNPKDSKGRQKLAPYPYSDGKNRYQRVLVKRK